MVIRPANASDLQACLEIDDSFETESVWQMEERVASNRISVGFRLARLPRPMRVRGIASREGLAESFKKKPSAFFVADDGVVRGYIQAVASRALEVLHVQRVVVAPALRRQGIGTQQIGRAHV